MMKNVLLSLILLVITLTGLSQSKSKILKDTIVWSQDYDLNKSDFQAKGKSGYMSYTEGTTRRVWSTRRVR